MTGDHPPSPGPLRPGDHGKTVCDLHRRLLAVGHEVVEAEVDAGEFGPDTARLVLRFQAERGLQEDGLVGPETLASLIEAGFRLGDRHLYLHVPMLRGDDVADLQLRLGSLGFDAGRIDGIFGPDTARALIEFQRNIALVTDGIAGVDTVKELRQLAGRSSGSTPVAQIRELDRLRRSRPDLEERRIALGQFGDCGALASALTRLLRTRGANVATLDHPDETSQAETANRFDADLYLGLRIENDSHSRIAYFATEGFHSEGGFRLANRCAAGIASVTPDVSSVKGMRLAILRRTRMPAVLCSLGPPSTVVQSTAELADALAAAISTWAADPAADD